MSSNQPGNEAIVVGGSLLGMLAARVLSEHFRSVVILDRDPAPDGPFPRKGSPQGAHVHVLLSKGQAVISRLFPGIFAEMEQAGALQTDSTCDLVWHHGGVWKARGESGIHFYMQSRPLIDWIVRSRILKDCPNIRFEHEVEADSLIHDEKNNRIAGVRIRPRGRPVAGKKIVELPCQLLVDAAGRGTRMPRWLRVLGYDEPFEEKLTVNIGYTTRLYEQPRNAERDWVAMMIYSQAPKKKLGYIYPVEPDAAGKKRWIVTMAGALGDHAPMTNEGFMEHARSLPRPDIYEWIQKGKPLTKFSAFKFPATRRLRYDRCKRLPEGFVAVGDALASFNPIYGQGISVGATGVELLENLIRKGGVKNLTRKFFRRAYWIVTAIPWLLVTAEDLRYKETPGKRPFGLPLLHWYTARVQKLSGQDYRISGEFFKVLHFINTPAALFQPYILFRVIGSALGLYKERVPNPELEYMSLPEGVGAQARLNREKASRPATRKTSKTAKKKTRTSTASRGATGSRRKKSTGKTAGVTRKKKSSTSRNARIAPSSARQKVRTRSPA